MTCNIWGLPQTIYVVGVASVHGLFYEGIK